MNTELILQYLADLESNNNREWYHANKRYYKEAIGSFEELIAQLIQGIGQFDGSILHNRPQDLTFKLVRDTRFSHDKTPYLPAFRAHISPDGKLPIPVGYFISIRPGNRSFLGGGLFAPMFQDATRMIREYIVQHGDEFQKIIDEEAFRRHFTVMGEKLKNVPKGYDINFPLADYLKNKSWYLEYPIPDELFSDPGRLIREAVQCFELMEPFNRYLNKALEDFVMPARK